MWMSVVLVLLTTWTVHPVELIQSFYIIPNNNTTCYQGTSANQTCYTLQQFSEKISNGYSEEDITLTFAPGKHTLVGGVEFNNTGNIVIKGQITTANKPDITCEQKSCFTFRNLSSIHIENIIFTECFNEDSDGGVIFVSETETVNITRCVFMNNSVAKNGGALRLKFIGNLHILQSQFTNNSALGQLSDTSQSFYCSNCYIASSGAISGTNITSFVMEYSLFDSNVAACCGGAVALLFSNIRVHSCRFYRNSVPAGNDGIVGGGGLFVESSSLQVIDSVFDENYAGNGCGIFSMTSILFISNCSFSLNAFGQESFSEGGAAYVVDTSLTVRDSIFSENGAVFGGALAVYSTDQDVYITNSTFLSHNRNTLAGIGGSTAYFQLSGEPDCIVSCGREVAPTGDEPVVSIVDSVFKSNVGGFGGGVVVASKGVLNLTRTEFIDNIYHSGGAIISDSNIVYFQENNFIGNIGTFTGSTLDLRDGIFYSSKNRYSENTNPNNGGAIGMINSTFIATDDQYTNNFAGLLGGAIAAYSSELVMIGCVCSKNNASLSGGAVFISDGTLTNIQTFYEANFATQNGGALLLTNSKVEIIGNVFLKNTINSGEGAAIFQTDNTIRLHNTTFTENQAIEENGNVYTVQLASVRGVCSDILFTSNVGAFYLFHTQLNFTGYMMLANNSGITGGALTLVQSTGIFEDRSQVNITNNLATYGGGMFLSQSELGVYTPLLKIDKNNAVIAGGGVFAYQSKIDIKNSDISESVRFESNIAARGGGGMIAIATNLNIFQGFVNFSSNIALRGGAAVLSQGSKIYLQKGTQERIGELTIQLSFDGNSAQYGGALFVADNTNSGVLCQQSSRNNVQTISTDECFIQILRLYYPRIVDFPQFNYMNIFFESNSAKRAGNDIFGGLLDRCQVNAFSEINNFVSIRNKLSGFDYLKTIAQFQIDVNYSQITQPFDPQRVVNAITREHLNNLVRSDPTQLCFCVNSTYDCSYQLPTIFAKRGEVFSVSAIAVDQVENPVIGTVQTTVISHETSLQVGQSQQITNGVCTELIYNVFSTEDTALLELYSDGPCSSIGISGKILNVTFLPCDCPNGLQRAPLDSECKCECDSSMKSFATSCQVNNNNTITVVRVSDNFWIQYFEGGNVTGFLLQTCPFDYCVAEPVNLSMSLPLNVDEQCAYNRSGIMCGECEDGLSLVFGSSRCVQCNNNYLALLIAFAFAGIALVAFILILNMTVAIGTIHGLILYANIVGANSPVFLPSETALRFFVSWVNLDLGIETCFYDGMDSYAKVLLQLVFPSYIIFLSLLMIIVSSYWDWFAGLIGRKNPVATLCTLFLLSYSKLLRTTIASLQFIYLTYPNGSNDLLWLYNPNVSYFATNRIPFFIVATVIIALGTVYTILLFFGQWFGKIPGKLFAMCTRYNKYNAFIDAYHAPFIVKHRYWIGVLLITRIVHHLLSAVLEESTYLLLVSSLMCALLILKQVITEAYKEWLIGFLETSYIINLLLFSVSSYYVSSTNGDQVALANTSVSIAFITFLGIVFYHTHTNFLSSLKPYLKLISSVKNCLHSSKQKMTKLHSSSSESISDEIATDFDNVPSSLHLHLLREPALDVIAPLSNDDYKRYSPPPAVSTPAPHLVTSTTVCIGDD